MTDLLGILKLEVRNRAEIQRYCDFFFPETHRGCETLISRGLSDNFVLSWRQLGLIGNIDVFELSVAGMAVFHRYPFYGSPKRQCRHG